MIHEYCVTYARDGEEVFHTHVEDATDEQAAIRVALTAAQQDIDVSDCDVRIAVIKRLPKELKHVIKLVMALGTFADALKVVKSAGGAELLTRESIERGVAQSVGSHKREGVWLFPSQEAEVEYYRRLATVLDTATPAPQDTGRPKTNLH